MATFSAGGRLSESVGGILYLGWRKEEGASISGKVTYAKEIEDGYWGIVAYSTPSFGPFSGMEFYNIGLYKPLRTFDIRIYSNANSSTRVGARSATGVQVYYDKDGFISEYDHFFITMGMYTPTQDNTQDNINMAGNILPFARVAYEYPIGDYNVILGAFAIAGGEHALDTEELRVKRETYGIDLQIEGEVFDKEASFILTNVLKDKVEFTGIGPQLTDHLEDMHNEAFSIEAAVSVTSAVVLKAGYMTYDDLFDYRYNGASSALAKINVKDLDYAINVGVDYGFSVTNVPMKLAVEYAWLNPALDRVKNYQSFMLTLTAPF